ncbi:unnamed protein product, partial [Timema podura]|nr:unnamed protein product [Timema podura]
AFPLISVLGNQLKDALSRIREATKALIDSSIAFTRIKVPATLNLPCELCRVFGSIPGTYRVFCEALGLERGHLSLVRTYEERYELRVAGSSLEN